MELDSECIRMESVNEKIKCKKTSLEKFGIYCCHLYLFTSLLPRINERPSFLEKVHILDLFDNTSQKTF